MSGNVTATFQEGDEVQSAEYGVGRVEIDRGTTVIVRFSHGLEECIRAEIERQITPGQALISSIWHQPIRVIARVQSAAIQSVNNSWGVFSRSRIALLPHQMWVCKRVTERWPANWLIADDVGLGKTIEAGLILWPLLSRHAVRRILILCPASLVDQWQWRLRDMFDLRFTMYSADADTPRSDYFNTQDRIVASLETLRLDNQGRQERLFESDPWDLVIVDEAHHLNFDERGRTLGYRLIEELKMRGKISSMIFFTGTPHRGKDFGFWSLLKLLDPEKFDGSKPPASQYSQLRDVMIRNNKESVTDLHGQPLFQSPSVTMEKYDYSEAEEEFYETLTDFISTGKAYASSLSQQDQRIVQLVLISMQKLASSSIAAIRRALKNRLNKIQTDRQNGPYTQANIKAVSDLETTEADSEFDLLSEKEESEWVQLSIQLMAYEEQKLQELIAISEKVTEETKIRRIMDIIEARFPDEPVLLFTEYKATQSLVMSELIKRRGDACVSFINGDGRAEEVNDSSNIPSIRHERREKAAEKFNSGEIDYLVSTEAGGEGIDLQERCHVLFHVDLPWNPMRLHQRVGRLNRYGQSKKVEVVGMRNPQTVEARIWAKLEEKLDSITTTFGHVMEDPEDLKQLVIGMSSQSMFRELFSGPENQDEESLSTWFDDKTASFGGKDVIDTVKELTGNASKFDFAEVSPQIPRVDLQDLFSFLKSSITMNGRQMREDDNTISFLTPQDWIRTVGVRDSYEGLMLDRQYRGEDANQRILGVGHPVVDLAISWADRIDDRVATLPKSILTEPLLIYRIADRVTTRSGVVSSVIVGVRMTEDNASMALLRDWELLLYLNELSESRGVRRAAVSANPGDTGAVEDSLARTARFVETQLSSLSLPFDVPDISSLAILWPVGESS